MKQTLCLLLLLMILAVLFLASCAPGLYSDPSLAVENARATLAAADSYAARTAQAQVALSNGATLSAAQTRDAISAMETMEARAAAHTQAALDSQATSTQHAANLQSTLVQATANASATHVSWQLTRTPLVATQTTLIRQQNWERWTIPARVILPVFFAAILGFLTLFWLWKAAPHVGPRLLDLLDAAEMRVRTIISPDGEMLTMLPRQREVNFYQAKRNFGSGAQAGPEGVNVSGVAPDLQFQADTTARHQAALLATHLPGKNAGSRIHSFAGQGRSNVRVLQPGERLPAGLVGNSEVIDALDAEWRDADETV